MSTLSVSGRLSSARRFSQAAHYSSNSQLQWPSPATLRHASISLKGRRRALDLYDTKDILFSHEQMKRATRVNSTSQRVRKTK
jgi:hypothetical protein